MQRLSKRVELYDNLTRKGVQRQYAIWRFICDKNQSWQWLFPLSRVPMSPRTPPKPHVPMSPFLTGLVDIPLSPKLHVPISNLNTGDVMVPCPLNPMSPPCPPHVPKPYVPMSNPKVLWIGDLMVPCPLNPMSPCSYAPCALNPSKPHVPMSNPQGV